MPKPKLPQAGVPAAENPDWGEPPQIQCIFLKSLRLQRGAAPLAFAGIASPALPQNLEVRITVSTQQISEGRFEVGLEADIRATTSRAALDSPAMKQAIPLTAATTSEDKGEEVLLFHIEASQCGIFDLPQMPTEAMERALTVSCPQWLYPYLRANVADAVLKAALPPLHLAEMDFQAMYHARHTSANSERVTLH